MGRSGGTIQTGVDGLVSLVHEKGRITFHDAAKLLGVSLGTIEEWAHFLAEEKVIDVEYNLRNPVLLRVELSPQQKQQMQKDFESERTIFHNRLNSVTSYFDQLDSQISRVNKIVEDLDTNLEHQIGDIKDELRILHTLEQQKVTLHEQLLDSKKRVEVKLKEIDKHLAEERIRYKQYETQEKEALARESKLFENATSYLERMKKEEQELEKKLVEVKKLSGEIEKSVHVYSKGIEDGEKRILSIKQKHDLLVKDLESEYQTINGLLKKNEDAEKEISKKVEETMKSISSHESKLDKKTKEVQELPSVVNDLIKNKSKIHEVISTIKHEEADIQQQMQHLQEKSRVIEFKIGTAEYKAYLAELNEKLDALTKRRSLFEEKIKQLIELLHPNR